MTPTPDIQDAVERTRFAIARMQDAHDERAKHGASSVAVSVEYLGILLTHLSALEENLDYIAAMTTHIEDFDELELAHRQLSAIHDFASTPNPSETRHDD